MKIELTEKQAQIVQMALEIYSRMRMGQFGIALDEAFMDKSLHWDEREQVETYLKSKFFPELSKNSYYGITSDKTGKDAGIAYEIRQTIRQYMAVKRNDGCYDWTNDYDDPLKVSEEPLPTIEGFVKWKEVPVPKKIQRDVIDFYTNKKYKEMWDLIIPTLKYKGARYELIYSNVYEDKEGPSVRIHRPEKIKKETI